MRVRTCSLLFVRRGGFLFMLLLTLLPLHGSAQQAVFSTDTKYMFDGARTAEDSLRKSEPYLESEWIIHGHHFNWLSKKPFAFTPDPRTMDTIFFHQSSRHDWDTLLCNVKYPGRYVFVFNECCGGFYLVNKRFKWVTPVCVDFRVEGEPVQPYVGYINGEGAVLKPGVSSRVDSIPRGAMDPNVCRVTMEEVYPCHTEADSCSGVIALQKGMTDDYRPYYWYEPKRTICSFLYIDLNNEALSIVYDPTGTSGKKLRMR